MEAKVMKSFRIRGASLKNIGLFTSEARDAQRIKMEDFLASNESNILDTPGLTQENPLVVKSKDVMFVKFGERTVIVPVNACTDFTDVARASRVAFDLQHVPVEHLRFSNDLDDSVIISALNVEDCPGLSISDQLVLSRSDEVEVTIGSASRLISVVGLLRIRDLVEMALPKFNLGINIADFIDAHVEIDGVCGIVRLNTSILEYQRITGRGTGVTSRLVLSRSDEVEVTIGSVSWPISVVGLPRVRNLVERALPNFKFDGSLADFTHVYVQTNDGSKLVKPETSILDLLIKTGRGTDTRCSLRFQVAEELKLSVDGTIHTVALKECKSWRMVVARLIKKINIGKDFTLNISGKIIDLDDQIAQSKVDLSETIEVRRISRKVWLSYNTMEPISKDQFQSTVLVEVPVSGLIEIGNDGRGTTRECIQDVAKLEEGGCYRVVRSDNSFQNCMQTSKHTLGDEEEDADDEDEEED